MTDEQILAAVKRAGPAATSGDVYLTIDEDKIRFIDLIIRLRNLAERGLLARDEDGAGLNIWTVR